MGVVDGRDGAAGTSGPNDAPAFGLPIDLVNVLQPGTGDTATISFYAAGIGGMFLLFSCGAGGTLLSPLLDLWPQVLVLTGLTVVFLGAARIFARRWETV